MLTFLGVFNFNFIVHKQKINEELWKNFANSLNKKLL